MWIANVESQELCGDVSETRVVAPSIERQGMRILPFFYSNSTLPKVVMMGTGGAIGFCKVDLMVEIVALSRTTIDRAYNFTVSIGRCFYCQYIDSIHSAFHSDVAHKENITYNLKLSKQFRQKAKKRP